MDERIKKDRGIRHIVCAQLFMLGAVLELLMFLGYRDLFKISSIITAILYSLVFPMYFLVLERDYLRDDMVKLHIKKAFKYILITIFFELIFTITGSVIVSLIKPLESNINVKFMENADTFQIVVILITLSWNLLGEEGGKLAFFMFADKYFKFFKMNENIRYYLIWFIDCLIFGVMHLSAYGNNILQCIFVIGIPSIVYGYLWKKTRNPFVMWLTHIVYDYSLIALSFM